MSTKSIQSKPLTITDAARHLGVTREHLSRVLHGHRESRSLRGRYAALGLPLPTQSKQPA